MWNVKILLRQLLALVLPSQKRTYKSIRDAALLLAKEARESAASNDERDLILTDALHDIMARQQTLREQSVGLKNLAVQLDDLK